MSYTLVTGGAKSGKSTFAESLLKDSAAVCYLATSVMNYQDAEMDARIQRHQKIRPASWQTEERFLAIDDWVRSTKNNYDAYLLDCVTVLNTNLFFHIMTEEMGKDIEQVEQLFDAYSPQERYKIELRMFQEWEKIRAVLLETNTTMILVTNEVGSGVVPVSAMGRWFQDLLGKVNQYLAKEAESVYFVICGIPQKIK